MNNDNFYLSHIQEATEYILSVTTNGKDAFLADTTIKHAVVRNFEIIGEAVKNLSTNLKTNNPDVDWRRIAGLRDRLVHGYFSVDYLIVWNAIVNELPTLKAKVEQLLQPPTSNAP